MTRRLDPLAWLDVHAAGREEMGLRRRLTPRSPTGSLLDLASNDYLGLSRHPEVIDGGIRALRTWGAGSTGSRLVTGTTELHETLEDELAAFAGTESALVFSSGYTANLAAVTALSSPDCLIVSDAANHASLIDACRLTRSRVEVVPHNDLIATERVLAGRTQAQALVITESINSIDGSRAPVRELHRISRAHGAVLVVDEAHGLGVCGLGGRGLCAAAGLAGLDDIIITATLSKALGSQGGVVLAPGRVVEHLIDTARTMIFDTGLAPACAGSALAALRVLRDDPGLSLAVVRAASELASAAGVAPPPSAIVPVVIGEPGPAVEAARRCAELGLRVGCFRPPSVPTGTSRLRLTARADLTPAELEHAQTTLRAVLADRSLDIASVLAG
ncbi:8-amino-7-oxononanoate synthase [Pseudonocardia petroleophila]|uniref:8-amino-7-oxononanoate synthase n=1 Tax=Pseudonocardia petroleophila TaxID=37331 RepID=A0A7G7MLP0_9PSEU|nr:8-amino-7-oxononanoate synthase [Pseudonocardia petroleophila]QNG53701.1 8-amino-7-oxononanoate synthase [Pseudonocardia petroleophila]